MPNARSFVPGREAVGLELGAHRLATPICYEVAHPADVRELVHESGATVIVTTCSSPSATGCPTGAK